jgi:RNA polymerase sigma factor (sigma-70 family)
VTAQLCRCRLSDPAAAHSVVSLEVIRPTEAVMSESSTPVNPAKALAVAVGDAIRRHRDGDRNAMDDLARLARPWLYRIALGHRLNHHSAEDVVQETLLSLLQHVDDLRDPEAGLGWLSTVARHEAIRIIRRDGREWESFAASDDPEQRVIELFARTRLTAAVERLPERCGRVIGLAFLADERDYSTISTALDMPVGSIGPTRQRALRRMRDLLSEDPWWDFGASA